MFTVANPVLALHGPLAMGVLHRGRIGCTSVAAKTVSRCRSTPARVLPRWRKAAVLGTLSSACWRVATGGARPVAYRYGTSCFRRSSVRRNSTAMAAATTAFATWNPMGRSIVIFGAANVVGLGVSLATGSHVHLDLIGTGAFIPVAYATQGAGLRSKLSAGMIGFWALRLASFLFYRALLTGHDARLDQTLSTSGGAIGFWAISWLWGVLTCLPHVLGAGIADRHKLNVSGGVALALCIVGLYWEIVADFQKWQFKLDPANAGLFCNVGLWARSQHPNYFGNLCLWTGIFVLNAPMILKSGRLKLLLGAMSPLFLALLFYGQASGKITRSAELFAQKYAGNPVFSEYVRSVPLIIPRLF